MTPEDEVLFVKYGFLAVLERTHQSEMLSKIDARSTRTSLLGIDIGHGYEAEHRVSAPSYRRVPCLFVGRPAGPDAGSVRMARYLRAAIKHQMPSTTPNGQAPDANP